MSRSGETAQQQHYSGWQDRLYLATRGYCAIPRREDRQHVILRVDVDTCPCVDSYSLAVGLGTVEHRLGVNGRSDGSTKGSI